MQPDSAKNWLQTLLPFAQAGGPFLTLGLAVVMCVSLWWMNAWLSNCVDHNRLMSAKLESQQQAFHHEMRLLVNCVRGSNP
jgi:hypothetical protein